MSICESCGVAFKSKHRHKNAKYCSYECSYAAKRKNQKICPICGQSFFASTKRQRTCSVSCGRELVRQALRKTCACCGKLFLPPKKGQRFCNKKCRVAYLISAKKKACRFCGIEFYPHKSDDEFCSRKCCNNFFKRTVGVGDKQCARCGTAFSSRKKNAMFCSDDCRIKTNKDLRRFRARDQEIGCKSITIAAVGARDGWICGICGKYIPIADNPNSNEAPSLDHIIPISKGGLHSWDNIQIAHRVCNSRKSSKTISSQLRSEIEVLVYG